VEKGIENVGDVNEKTAHMELWAHIELMMGPRGDSGVPDAEALHLPMPRGGLQRDGERKVHTMV